MRGQVFGGKGCPVSEKGNAPILPQVAEQCLPRSWEKVAVLSVSLRVAGRVSEARGAVSGVESCPYYGPGAVGLCLGWKGPSDGN